MAVTSDGARVIVAAVTTMKNRSVVETASRLGRTVRQHAGTASGGEVAPCPRCGAWLRNGAKKTERRLAIGVTGTGRGWKCHAKNADGEWCGASGDALDLIAWDRAGARWRDLTREQKLDVAGRVHELFGFMPVPPVPTAPAEAPRSYPPQDEVARVWADGLTADFDNTIIDALASRSIDASHVARLGLAKTVALDAQLPRWARLGARTWAASGHRLMLEMVDPTGQVRSLVARAPAPDVKPKSVAPQGFERRGLMLANEPARALLRGTVGTSAPIVVAEGEVDHLSWSLAHGGPVLSVVSGSWNDEWAQRLMSAGASIVVATDPDAAGDSYATKIISSLGEAVAAGRVSRWPARADRVEGLADANAYVTAGRVLRAVGEPCAPTSTPTATKTAETDGWKNTLKLTRYGKVAATAHNLLVLLTHDAAWEGVLAYDERREATVVMRTPPWTAECATPQPEQLPRVFSDADAVRLTVSVERMHDVTFAIDAVHRVVDTIAQEHRVDPVREWMASLCWDAVPRLDRWLTTYLGVCASPLADACGARWLISAVARTMRPGAQADHVLVLVGPQAAGKSSVLRALASDAWFADQIASLASKDASIGLVGPLIIELAELEALKRADLAMVKAFISRRHDNYRPPYGRRNVSIPRRVIFAASTNEGEFLRDPTGARRFWAVQVGEVGALDVAGIERDREQLFAEAVARYRAGEQWWLHEPHLDLEAKAAAEARRQADPWEMPIETHIARKRPAFVTIAGLLTTVLGIPVGKHDQVASNRVAAIMRDRLRWLPKQRRVLGQPTRMYVPPTVTPVTGVTRQQSKGSTKISKTVSSLTRVVSGGTRGKP